MTKKNSVFDLIGPVMIGPSSSHTAGVLRIARVGYELLGCSPEQAKITFYNSFAKTYQGHGSHYAVLGGLLGYDTDDKRIRDALVLAKNRIDYTFIPTPSALDLHANTIRLQLTNSGEQYNILGVSTGGGKILITQFNGFDVRFAAAMDTLILYAKDQPGSIAHICQLLSSCNIATMTVSRQSKYGRACVLIECDEPIDVTTQQNILQLHWIEKIWYTPKLY